MQPIECPDGFRPARSGDHALMVAFLNAEFAKAMRPGGDVAEHEPAYWCKAGVDSSSLSYSAVNGCVSLPPNAGWAMAEGIAAYRCKGSPKALLLGVEADGEYQ